MTPLALTIAGSDSGGGAGVQADLKTFADLGVFGTSAITALTAQNSQGVHRVDAVPVEGLVAQIRAVMDDFEVHAVKIGMLGSAAHVSATAAALRSLEERPPIVLDPVMVASTGHRLLEPDAEAALVRELMPLATVVTPNLDEAAVLAGRSTQEALVAWAKAQSVAVLLTGGDVVGDTIHDVLVANGAIARQWNHPRVGNRPFHGTGCTTSSAIAAGLARGQGLVDAIDQAIAYVQDRIADAHRGSVGQGNPSLIHGRGRHPAWANE
ncbi:MAG: bifunctional hydroxymethylpyrimidine kinase/phosphomethylpyrimidine kinase [Myxococcota bacterium]